jgi:hypothetical protein
MHLFRRMRIFMRAPVTADRPRLDFLRSTRSRFDAITLSMECS